MILAVDYHQQPNIFADTSLFSAVHVTQSTNELNDDLEKISNLGYHLMENVL